MIGSTRDDMTMMMLGMPWFGSMDQDGLRKHATGMFGELGEPIIGEYARLMPSATPTQVACAMVTDRTMWAGSIHWAEIGRAHV